MVAGFGILVLAALFIAAGISGRSLAEVVRGEVGRGFALADIKVPTIVAAASPPGGAQTASLVTGGTGGTRHQDHILEVFYDPLNAYLDAPDGIPGHARRVAGRIGGHTDHVHVGGDRAWIAGYVIPVLAPRFHLRVSSYIRPTDSDSYHRDGRAVDLAGSSADMMALARYLVGG